jgi:hypothetical protein
MLSERVRFNQKGRKKISTRRKNAALRLGRNVFRGGRGGTGMDLDQNVPFFGFI